MNTETSLPVGGSSSQGIGALLPLMILGLVLVSTQAMQARAGGDANSTPLGSEALRKAAGDGTIAFRLTTPDELERRLGKPQSQRKEKEGDMVIQVLEYPGVAATFCKIGEFAGPYTLYELRIGGEAVDIGRERQLVLRTVDDLGKLDSFRGISGVSLARLDLRENAKDLSKWTFDSRTVWPAADRLPAGFDPAQLLEDGKNPGLGVRKLHAAGIDGKGVGIAIIDQPLLREHEEYKDRVVKYTEVDVAGIGPQMHGPAVASIAVGKHCGVAPGAALYYFAVPPWKWLGNEPWAEELERIVELNKQLTDTPKIRVVSISLGAFSERPNLARWKQAVKKAEAEGILVVTCDPDFLYLATLKRIETSGEPTPTDYKRGLYGHPFAVVCVPAANRTIASFWGPSFYTYDRTGGMSWTVPYLAGVAALAWQVDPSITPQEMIELWKRTAVKAAAGPVINPAGIIEAAKSRGTRS